MSILGAMFGKKKAELTTAAKKFENRDLMEALVGGKILMMYCDGKVEDSELTSLEAQLQANPSLEHFGPEINATINKFSQMFDSGFRMGKLKVMREIADVKSSQLEKEEVFVAMITMAEADGDIDAKELDVLKEVGRTLGLNLKDYGIDA